MAISRKPKLYAIAFEHHSLTLQLMKKTDQAWLHVLRKTHADLIRPLGQRSGHKWDKHQYLDKRDWLLKWNGFPVLKHCVALLELQKLNAQTFGDHDLFVFEVKSWKSISDKELLTFKFLQERGLIL